MPGTIGCMEEIWWYLTRATGVVATVLSVAALVLGLLFSGRMTSRPRPNWYLAMHNWLGGLTIGFIVAHIAAAYLDPNQALQLLDLFVPSVSSLSIAMGVVATWMFLFTAVPSMRSLKKRIPRSLWYVFHLLSFPAVALSLVHAYQLGSDVSSTAVVLFAALVGCAVYPTSLRLIAGAQKQLSSMEHS